MIAAVLRAIFFDFNGVLLDDEPIHMEALQRIFADEGVTLESEEYYDKYVGVDDQGCLRGVLKKSGREADQALLARLAARKASYYQERIKRDGYSFFPGAVALVESATADSMTLAVVSGALRQEVEDALRNVGIRPLFKAVIAAEDVRRGKPDPEGYLAAIEELNSRSPLPERLFHPHEILAIEDTLPGLEAAAGAGLLTLGVAHTLPRKDLDIADVRVDELDGVTTDSLQAWYAETSRS